MRKLEEIARALALADLDEETRRNVDIDAHMAHVSGHYMELALAAVRAMRTANNAMYRAAADALVPAGDAAACWYAMIDAILSEEDGE